MTRGFYFRNDLDWIHGRISEEENEERQVKPKTINVNPSSTKLF